MISTGIKGLDEIVTGLRVGDNVVWQIDDISDYRDFVDPFLKKAKKDGKKVVYLRFAEHEPLVQPGKNIKIYELDARNGFEPFSSQVNRIATEEGEGTYYVFDCLSELLSAWATDLMIGNFFMVTCPYLYELNTIAYFSILRNSHSFKTIARIRETTQLLIDVYNCEGSFYVHPLKVWNRYSPTMFLPHLKEGDDFTPITDSANTARLLSRISRMGVEETRRNLDYWDRLFMEAEDLVKTQHSPEEQKKMVDKLCRIMISRDEKILELALQNFILEDLLEIKSRLVGTGFIGGKAVGMLLARKILEKDTSRDWQEVLEPHDSFYIGSDVFYSYIVQNDWWQLRMEQKTKEGYFDAAAALKERLLHGTFPDEIMEKFQQVIEYFGQSPIIVRSSSLLEDGFGNAFAGKYESIFSANQGTPEQRYLQFAEAVRQIFSSTMNEDALSYRLQRGLDQADEQMALLVQRVSGDYHKKYFFPDLAGVGVSYNTYVWNKDMDPEAGMLRIVAGLGTRSVNRVEGDYPRIAALDRPLLRPHAGMDDAKKYSQSKVDLIDIESNSFATESLSKLIDEQVGIKLDKIAVRDYEATRFMKERGKKDKEYWVLTFDELFSKGDFSGTMKKMLKILEENYNYPVDIEFTVNFASDGTFRINLVQCRPLQTRVLGKKVDMPKDIPRDKVLLDLGGYFFGGNVSQNIKRIIYVDPEGYTELPASDKYDIARLVGKLNKSITDRGQTPTLLLGPGRWGTTTPSLGVPVSFAEINNVTVLGEIAFEGGNLIPELSFGTHFFQDLVEADIFYLAIFPGKDDVFYNKEWLDSMDDKLTELFPEAEKYRDIVRVFDVSDDKMKIISDILDQKIICYSQK